MIFLEQTLIYLKTDKKNLYSRLVLVTSLFPSEMIKMGRIKKSHKGVTWGAQLRKSWTDHIFLSFNNERSSLPPNNNEASEGHQVHN